MPRYRTILVLTYFFSVLAGVATATDRPDWVGTGSRKEDPLYRYYVGRAASLSEADAFSEARRDAQLQAIRDNYGTSTQVELRAVENSTASQTLKSFDEEFPKVSFDGFEQVESHVESDKGNNGTKGVEVWALFRYPKTTITREKLRLAKNPTSLPAQSWSEQGSKEQARKHGKIEISSEPAGADVFIDDKRYGVTPLRLLGVLEEGRHQLVIDHPGFSTYSEKFSTYALAEVNIHKKLRKALGYLTIETAPAGARVRIEGHPAGVSPVRKFPVSAGINVAIEIVSEEGLPLSTQVTVARDRHESRFYTLDSKTPRRLSHEESARADKEARLSDKGQKEVRALLGEHSAKSPDSFSVERSIYTFSLLPAGYTGSPTSTIDIPHSLFGGSFSVDFSPHWYWEFAYRFGQREVQYADALVSARFHHLSLATGLQINLWERHLFSAELTISRLFASYSLRPVGVLQFRTSPAMSQWGLGGAIRYRWLVSADTLGLLTTGWGLGTRLAAMSYLDANAITRGKVALEGELQCFFLF